MPSASRKIYFKKYSSTLSKEFYKLKNLFHLQARFKISGLIY